MKTEPLGEKIERLKKMATTNVADALDKVGVRGAGVVPHDRAEEVLRAALEIDEAEQKILEMLEKGITMREARKQLGYHQLQSKRS
jgi:regulator of RNase E activity RraA